MKEAIYLETTVVSYYTSKPSRDIIVRAHQQITQQGEKGEKGTVLFNFNHKH